MCVRVRRALLHQKIHLKVIWAFFLKVRKREGGKKRTRRDERTCGLKSLWASKRLLPYCFETIHSDISCVTQRTADHTHMHTDTQKQRQKHKTKNEQ